MKAKQLDKGVDQLMEEVAQLFTLEMNNRKSLNSWSTTIRSNTIPFRAQVWR
jgi:hypothetical protein